MVYVANEPTLIYNLYIDCTCIYSAHVLILINTQLAISEKLLNIYTVPLLISDGNQLVQVKFGGGH